MVVEVSGAALSLAGLGPQETVMSPRTTRATTMLRVWRKSLIPSIFNLHPDFPLNPVRR
jgi:hypothetical protein